MLTLFTTTKAFIGKNRINQLNAIRSWLTAPYPVEVIIFDEVKGDATEELINHNRVRIVENVATNQSGIPRIDAMFDSASRMAQYGILCFLNADIMLPPQFFSDISAIDKRINKNYLIVGQRIDVDVDEEVDFSGDWLTTFLEEHPQRKLHKPTGSDFFVFPKGQYTTENMPELLVGRPGWDLWMIYNAVKRKLKTIDLSFSTKVIHQNHDYSHKKRETQQEDDNHNYQFFPSHPHHLRYRFQLIACNYYFSRNELKKNYARGDIDKFLSIRVLAYGNDWRQRVANKLYYFKFKTIRKLMPNMYNPN